MLMHDGADVDAWVGGLVLGGEVQCRPAAWAGRAPAGATTPAGVDGAFATVRALLLLLLCVEPHLLAARRVGCMSGYEAMNGCETLYGGDHF
jgi:hypothetical protein